ncbi:uncharacterized protein V1510DRAFT_375316 [Dipodascopsis tothii]|uniref:uncharacterized protein n=1 Tax=Dipodascopsis tothii TaxID=44089 RepID=UPI0034CF4D5A
MARKHADRFVDDKAIARARARQLRAASGFVFLLLGWFGALVAVAIALFSSGFLLSRIVLDQRSECAAVPGGGKAGECWHPKAFDRAVVVVIDALRYDFLVPPADESLRLECHDALRAPLELATADPARAALFRFVADPPTTTIQRLKGLTTGSLPTFVDAGSNFAAAAVAEDNVVDQLAAAGKRIVFAGDDTWTQLFGPGAFAAAFPFESFNVPDLDTVDRGIEAHLNGTYGSAAALASRDWDVLVTHFLGVDHAGHRFGPDHPAMRAKLAEMDAVVRRAVAALDDRTLLVVLGDHGMDARGDHGGESALEVDAGLFLYAKRPFFAPTTSATGAPPTVDQIDLVPTLALLLGVPVPYSNLGAPIAAAFLGPTGKNHGNQLAAARVTARQIARYRAAHPSFRGDGEIAALFGLAERADGRDPAAAAAAYARFQQASLAQARAIWARFDALEMAAGLAVFAVALAAMAVYACGFADAEDSITDFAPYILQHVATYGGAAGVPVAAAAAAAGMRYVPAAAFGLAVGSAAGYGRALFALRRMLHWPLVAAPAPALRSWPALAAALVLAHTALFWSNSYVVWEDASAAFLLATVGVVFFVAAVRLPADHGRRRAAIVYALVFVAATQLAARTRVCREEQLPHCVSTFYSSETASPMSSPFTLAKIFVSAVVLPYVLRYFLGLSRSYEGAASWWIGIAMRTALLCVAVFWTLDTLEVSPAYAGQVAFPTAKLVLARLLLGVSLVGGNMAWFRSCPLCLRVDMTNNQDRIKRAVAEGDLATANKLAPVSVEIIGFANTYGSLYLLFVANAFVLLAIVAKPAAGFNLALLFGQTLVLFELAEVFELDAAAPALVPVVLSFLGSVYFFATGHQATMSAIQWDTAFIFNSSASSRLLPALAVVLNSVGPQVFVALALPLATLWKHSPSPKDFRSSERLLYGVSLALVRGALYTTAVAATTAAAAAYFRRHLMLWKIFAPRFILAQLVALVAGGVGVAGLAGFAAAAAAVIGVYDVFK